MEEKLRTVTILVPLYDSVAMMDIVCLATKLDIVVMMDFGHGVSSPNASVR